MSSIIRGGERLAKFSDRQLGYIVASCISFGIDGEALSDAESSWQARGRKMVVKAVCAYDLLVHKMTVSESFPASDESRAWSSFEGGHRFFHVPTYDIAALITGHIQVQGVTVKEAR